MAKALNRQTMIIILAVVVVAGVAAGLSIFLVEENTASSDGGVLRSDVPLYQKLGTMVVNLLDDDEETHFMQVDVTLMTRNVKCAKALEYYVPVFRNAMLDLFARQGYKRMLVPAEREVLRKEALDVALKVATMKMKNPQIEDVLFTGFVVQ
ncbi:flagellar basal body-associated FliL family protein [Sansalvadorimonas sp. 2012CJ34-2]|uniref:Flagellar protein FliL n=1 Tax=Parendozoicomonas callyspongiae TaxID=2942213 RepID=A0ABT0PGD0_9GAMM|nr:flagellar basal body-associated FliL family protein [Sansalvadorimonas sp. 2012CJ34-2]MCL6269563.1 flagellar basal body-associated FliL family protein [Sansalvadorimonas sp. 2012CJ34-2]